MALKKEIELENGVVLNYHRITTLSKMTNISNTIEVNSYVSKTQRLKEREYQKLQIKNQTDPDNLTDAENEELNKGINVIVEAQYITIPYDSEMTITDAYNYLKTTDIFKNAENDD